MQGLCTIIAHPWFRSCATYKSGAFVATGNCSDNQIPLIEGVGVVEVDRKRADSLLCGLLV